MKYVILRDDDTCALTPVDALERLYRPFLDRGLPVNLSTIPRVSTKATAHDGSAEMFLMMRNPTTPRFVPLGCNTKLVEYLKKNDGFHIVQHGYTHERVNTRPEFDHENRTDLARRLDEGTRFLLDAGFDEPNTFVAPYDQLSREALLEVSERFRILSTGWYESRKLPVTWLPQYALKKAFKQPHWKVRNTILLTHPGCHLSFHRSYDTMLDEIIRSIDSRKLTVLVTHWWEYFRENKPDERFINVLHETADYLSRRNDIEVISFDELAEKNISPN